MPRRSTLLSRVPFLIAVALIAAALGDALVETVANTGIVGHGYDDDNHLSVIPALVGGISFAVLAIVSRCVGLFRDRRGWLIGMAKHIAAGSPLADLPCVLLFQFLALFIMESSEQLCLGGKLLGATAWLGGPIWFSVLLHATLGSLCLFAIAHAMRAIVKRCAALVRIALELIRDAFAREACGVFASRRDRSQTPHDQTLRVHQIGGRAPPPLLHAIA